MQEKEVIRYLKAHPDFLKDHAMPLGLSPSLEQVIALSEKHLSKLHQQHEQLKKHLVELTKNASANDVIEQQQHLFALSILSAKDLKKLVQGIADALQSVFDLPYSALKLWHKSTVSLACYHAPSKELLQFLEKQSAFCAHYVSDEMLVWLPKKITFQSFAVLPLLHQKINGVLLIGSKDHERFAPTLHSHYLQMMAEKINAALLRYLD